MKKSRIYVDTSVIGGCCDPEFELWSRGLLADFQRGLFTLLLSAVTHAEIQDAPPEVKEVYGDFLDCEHVFLRLTTEAIELADAYLGHKILTENYRDDARHVALATVGEADVLASWNFRHVVRYEKIQKFNAVNMELGYKPIAICSPREVSTYERESR